MKVLFIAGSVAIVYVMKYMQPHKSTYNAEADSFPLTYLLGPCAVVGVLINMDHTSPFEILWAFSIYLEAVAIMPQLYMLQKEGSCENLNSHYVASLGAYRAFYLLNWIYRYFTEDNYVQLIAWFAGIVQTGLYCDFFYNYWNSKKKGGANAAVKISLPV